MPAQRQRELTIAALLDQLGGLAARQPVLMVLEDSQWLDPTSTELFERVIERVQTLPVLLLITFSPGVRAALDQLPAHDVADPEPSGPPAQHRDDRGGCRRQAAARQRSWTQIWAKTEGVPLFVEELTKTVLEAGLLEDRG